MNVLDETSTNIQQTGEVPFTEQVIRISIPCQPCVTSEVDVSILFNFSFPIKSGINLTTLSLKRKKVCVAKLPPVMCSEAFMSANRKKFPSSSSTTLSSSSGGNGGAAQTSLSFAPAANPTSSLSSSSILRSESQSAAIVVTIGYAAAFTFLVVFFVLMCTRRGGSGGSTSGSEKEISVLTRHDAAGFSRASSDFSLKKIPPPAESCRSVSRYGEIEGIWFL
jgi:hypothetical protein